MGERGAAGAPELGMTGFSYILPTPRGLGLAYSDGFAKQGASHVPIKAARIQNTAIRGLNQAAVCYYRFDRYARIKTVPVIATRLLKSCLGSDTQLGNSVTQVGEGIPARKPACPLEFPVGERGQ
jgi:hypothetical protein